jgi:hypothetical protein
LIINNLRQEEDKKSRGKYLILCCCFDEGFNKSLSARALDAGRYMRLGAQGKDN